MALFDTMGESSSPLFLTADTAGGLDLGPLEYYYKKKEAADADLAKKLTAKPDLPEFKADALPGQKDVLELMYKKSMSDIKKGVQKYGGLWGIYANSEEGKRDIAGLNITQYNLEMGETNKKRFQGVSSSVTQEGKSNVRYLDPSGKPIYFKDKDGKIRSATNEDMLQMKAKDRAYDPQTGELLAMDFNYTRGDSKTVNNEIFGLAEKAKNTSWATGNPVLQPYSDGQGGVLYGSNVMQGYDAYNYITYVKNEGSSNKQQLNAAIGVLYNNLSQDAKDGILNEIYDGREGKRGISVSMPTEDKNGKVTFKQERIDYEKFDTDDVYRQQVIDAYTIDRVSEGTKPFISTSSKVEQSYNVLGKAEGLGFGDQQKQADLGFTQLLLEGKITPSNENAKYNRLVDDGDGTYTLVAEQGGEFYGKAVDDAYGDLNAQLQKSPQLLTQVFGNTGMMIYGTVLNTTEKVNPMVESVAGFSYKSPMVQDENGNWRNINKSEQSLYDAAKAKKDSGQELTEAEIGHIDKYGPQLYMDLNVNFGDEDRTVNYQIINPETGEKEPITNATWYSLGIYDYTSDVGELAGIEERGENWVGTISIPANAFMGLQAKTDKQFQGNVEQQQKLQASFNQFVQQQIKQSEGAGSYQSAPTVK
jgi:hypothetical protein